MFFAKLRKQLFLLFVKDKNLLGLKFVTNTSYSFPATQHPSNLS